MIIDIHSHIIPNVDDGSRSLEESLGMLASYASQGITHLICTPHNWAIDELGIDYVRSRFNLFKRAAQMRHIPVELSLGCEVLVHRRTIDDCIEKLKNGTYPTLAGSRYVLIEFRKDAIDASMRLRVMKLVEAGFIPVVAHAERYIHMDLETAESLKELGALLQINLYSISFNETDEHTSGTAHELIKNKLADFVGSDAHNFDHRPPVVEYALWVLPLEVLTDYATKITRDNPQKIIENLPLAGVQ